LKNEDLFLNSKPNDCLPSIKLTLKSGDASETIVPGVDTNALVYYEIDGPNVRITINALNFEFTENPITYVFSVAG
jgi:hypothetical protein